MGSEMCIRDSTKVEADPAAPRRILTVWGRGYKLSATADGKDEGAA